MYITHAMAATTPTPNWLIQDLWKNYYKSQNILRHLLLTKAHENNQYFVQNAQARVCWSDHMTEFELCFRLPRARLSGSSHLISTPKRQPHSGES